jgi:two-component system nitrogen regulation sensor histidine kinase NtrY
LLSGLRIAEPNVWLWLRRIDLERKLALLLAILALISGIATYMVISTAPPYASDVETVLILLNIDLVILLLLAVIIARRLVIVGIQRRKGLAGSRLHARLVGLFSLVAVTPAIIVAVFSFFFLNSGLEAWFSDRIRTALENSLAVAEAYLNEHQEIIRADALAMAADLNREEARLLTNPGYFVEFVNAQASIRSLTEAVVFDATGNVLVRSGLTLSLESERLRPEYLERAKGGEVVVLTSGGDDRVRALLRLDWLTETYLFVGRFVDANVVTFMNRTQNVTAEYQRIQSERRGIQITSALIFAIVALLLLLSSIWIGLNFADRLASPISQLVVAADRVRRGDLTARVPDSGDDDEVSVMSRAFNRMASQLSSQRRELIDANHQLDGRRRFTEAVLSGVSSGVIGLDSDLRIVLPNPSAMEILSTEGGAVIGTSILDHIAEMAPLLARVEARPHEMAEAQLTLSGHGQRTLLVRISAQHDDDRVVGYVVTFDDISALLSAQRQAAWAEIAKRIAHEIKNPLTPIRLSAERLNRKYLPQIKEGRESFQNSTTTIQQQVDAIGRLVSEFANFARLPAADLKPESIDTLIKNAVFLQQTAHSSVSFKTDFRVPVPVTLSCDGEQVAQALNNLLLNATNALTEAGTENARIVVSLDQADDDVVVEIADNGPGFPQEHRDRLLEPYVTTRSRGTGLGLAIVRKIMDEHHGKIELEDGADGGAVVRLRFPRSADASHSGGREQAAANPMSPVK